MNLPQPAKQHYYEQVWTLVQQIPHGSVSTYGQIAKMLPVPAGCSADDYQTYASRWVGSAMAACPEGVPWQRVVNAQGKISPRAEASTQKMLLEKEGVLFTGEKINLKTYQWHGTNDNPKQVSLF